MRCCGIKVPIFEEKRKVTEAIEVLEVLQVVENGIAGLFAHFFIES